MDSFYIELIQSVTHLEKNLRNPKKLFQHNHQPLSFTVKDCIYCSIYGNILDTSNNNPRNVSTTTSVPQEESITYSIHYDVLN